MIAKVFHQFTVPGQPTPWARAAKSGKRHYTPAPQAAYKIQVQIAARMARVPMLSGAVALTIRAWWACPKSYERVREPFAGGVKATKPDADNVAKLFLDALNGLAYTDDAQVVELHIHKAWSVQGEPGRVVVRYWSVTG